MAILVRFVNCRRHVITSVLIQDDTADKDLRRWVGMHCGGVNHLSVIYRLYARNRYKHLACVNPSRAHFRWVYDVEEKDSRIVISATPYFTTSLVA